MIKMEQNALQSNAGTKFSILMNNAMTGTPDPGTAAPGASLSLALNVMRLAPDVIPFPLLHTAGMVLKTEKKNAMTVTINLKMAAQAALLMMAMNVMKAELYVPSAPIAETAL